MENEIEVRADFSRARSKARNSAIASFIRRRSDDLLSFEDVKKAVQPAGEHYVGCKTILVDRVVGSEGRCGDFNKSFMPRREFMCERWARVDRAFYEKKDLPAVKVLEIGGVYFVRDGNHRVSVARHHNVAFIDADITSLVGNVELEPGMSIQDIARMVRSAETPRTAA
jgi:hypothetical protein